MTDVIDPYASLGDLGRALARGEVTSRSLAELYLGRIARYDGALHAWAHVFADEALVAADGLDRLRSAGVSLGPLHGIPVGLKDLFEWQGRPCEAGSATWAGRLSPHTSTVTQRLLAAGMVVLGKLHMVEFAFGGMGTNPRLGAPRNPWDGQVARIAGGSSSGSGVAVAAALAPVALGSDTGGSIRIPANINGIVGLKPTYGRVSLARCVPLSTTLDSNGPMTRTVEDAALLLEALSGPDPDDPTTAVVPRWSDAGWRSRGVAGMRIAVLDIGGIEMDGAVREAFDNAQRVLRELGATLTVARPPIDFPGLRAWAGKVIAAEAYALHRRELDDPAQPFSWQARERLDAGRALSAADYVEALAHHRELQRVYRDFMTGYEALLTPGVPRAAIPLDTVDEAQLFPATFTRAGNYCGACGLALPGGWDAHGLPVGIQLLGRPFGESDLLALGAAYERAMPQLWQRHPDLAWARRLPA